MPTRSKALTPNPTDLTPAEAAFVRLIATEGFSIKDASKHEEVKVSTATGYRWFATERIKEAVYEAINGNRLRIQMRATGLVDRALQTLGNALVNPNITPTQVKAAQIVLQYAAGNEKVVDGGVRFTVEVNTQLNTNVLAEQQARATLPAPVYEGGFSMVVDDDDE